MSGVNYRRVRSWTFANCAFDEANWSLTIDGRRVSVETKPLELLRKLMLHAGNVVSKDELLDAIWPNVTVVEASLPTAVRKLRLALGDDRRERSIIETVPGIGYRFSVPVEVEELADAPKSLVTVVPPAASGAQPPTSTSLRAVLSGRMGLLVAGGGLAIAVLATLAWLPSQQVATNPPRVFSDWEAITALRRLDVAKIDAMLAAGWKPDAPMDTDHNNALNRLLEMCEWDPGHDREKMLLVARSLLDGGVVLNSHNAWGDTAYSIAKAKRYCGPDHPVTVMLRNMCYAHGKVEGDTCLATYELKRRTAA